MLELPSRRADARDPLVRREWRPAGYPRLRAAAPGVAPAHLLCALLAIAFDRYGVPGRLVAEPGAGAPDAALRLLAADRGDTRWPELLAAVGSAEAPVTTVGSAEAPAVLA